MPFQPIEKQTAADAIFDQLSEEILRGRLATGDALPAERALSDQLGVSRPAVREALQRLAQAGLVDIRHGDATRVRDYRDSTSLELLARLLVDGDGNVDAEVVRSLLEMRVAVGADAARRCAQRAGKDVAVRLRRLADSMAASDADLPLLQELDLEFWDTVVDGSGNIAYRLAFNALRRTYEPLADLLTVVLTAELRDHESRSNLVAAVADHDAAAAEDAARHVLEASDPAWAKAMSDGASEQR